MNNGCPKCEKLPSGILCPKCEIGMLEHEAEAALKGLITGYRKLLKLESEVDNGKEPTSSAKSG